MQLTKRMIDKIFEEATNQEEYIYALYRAVVPDWDLVVRVKEFPKTSEATSKYIFNKAREFDLEYHPDIFAMGAWLNSGFSTDRKLKTDWEVIIEYGDIEYSAQQSMKEAV